MTRYHLEARPEVIGNQPAVCLGNPCALPARPSRLIAMIFKFREVFQPRLRPPPIPPRLYPCGMGVKC